MGIKQMVPTESDNLLVRDGQTINLLWMFASFSEKNKQTSTQGLTPVSPVRAIVREHIPLQASQKRIS